MSSSESIAQFIDITGSSSDVAQTYLTQADGDLETAVQNFFASAGGEDEIDDQGVAAALAEDPVATGGAVAAEQAPAGPRTLSGAPAPPPPSDWGSGRSLPKATGGGGSSSLRIKTFSELAAASSGPSGSRPRHNHDDDDDDEEEDDEPERLYAGGERSGLSVENPDSRPSGRGDLVKNLLKQAAEGSRRRGTDVEPAAPPAPSLWQGSGNRLGSADDPEPEPELNLPGTLPNVTANTTSANVDLETPVRRTLTFWSDGFSIEDGPLMAYTDPQHQESLAQLQSGRAPLSLLNVAQNQRVDVIVADRRREAFIPPKPTPFGGGGNRLGSSVPAAATPAPLAQPSTSENSPSSHGANVEFEVDEGQPTTRLQVVLADGSRFPVTVNQHHTLADVRRLIDAGHRGSSGRPYTLWLRMPKKLLDESQTVKEAGVLNAVIVQTLT